MLLFEDISLHYIEKGNKKWQSDEALSQIIQVEILDQLVESDDESDSLTYLKSMNEPVSMAQIPGRIIRRYTENLNFILKSVNSFVQLLSNSEDIFKTFTEQGTDQFGYEKVLVVLTKPNKVFALSSLDGSVLWSFFDNKKIEKIFVKQNEGQFKVALIMQDELVSLDSQTGNLISRQPLTGISSEETGFIMVRDQNDANVLLGVPKNAEGKITVLDNNPADLADTPLYFTSVSKDTGKISGYRINTKTLTSDSIWTISLGNKNKIIDIKTQYET